MVWFNAWMHDAAPNLSAALAADVARHATRYRDPWTRLWHPLPSSILSPKERARRRFWLAVAALISAIFLFLFGTGPVKGFAVTLVIGLISNMFTAVFVSRTLFEWVLNRKQRTDMALSI